MHDIDFLRIIADNTRDVISIFDPMFVRMYVSPSVIDLIGYTPSEIISMTVNQPIPAEDAAYVGPLVRSAIEKGESCTVEHRLIHKNRTIVWVEVVVRPIFSQSGKLCWILTSARNISDRKSKERELETERRLRQELYSISSLSHEIRTPLAILVSTLELLRQSANQPEHFKLLNTLDSVSHTLSGLVNNVLDYARLREGKSQANCEDFDLYELCEKVHKVHSTVAADKGLQFDLHVDQSVSRNIYSDPHKLKQVLTNLIGNAIKFTPTGSVQLRVTEKGTDINFEIIDTGIGIPPRLIEEIFEPFKQQSEANEEYGGSGLGLSIVKSLLSLLGGSISVESKINEGSKFVFSIPFVPATQDIAPRSRGDVSGMKILFVDDLLISQDLHKRLFEKAGAYCHVCSTVAQSLALDPQNTFDVILLDVHTSDQNSLPLIGALKTKYQDAPVIVYSADTSDDVVTTAKLFGAADFVYKPVEFKILLEIIGRYKRFKLLDLAIYEDIYHSDQKEYFRAIALLIDDFNFFEKEFKRCLAEHDSRGLKKIIHRIKPIAKQTKCTPLLKLLASGEQIETQLEWEQLEKSKDTLIKIVDSILAELMKIQTRDQAWPARYWE